MKYLDAFMDVRPDEDNSFRFILSPEHTRGVPFVDFTRQMMAMLERELGYKVPWCAISHYDTAHPHVHITVRGLNEFGSPLFIPKKMLLHGCRVWAREIVTNYLGERTNEDIVNAYLADAVASRFTKLDGMLKTNSNDNNGIVDFQMFHAHRDVAHGVVAALGKRLDFFGKDGAC